MKDAVYHVMRRDVIDVWKFTKRFIIKGTQNEIEILLHRDSKDCSFDE